MLLLSVRKRKVVITGLRLGDSMEATKTVSNMAREKLILVIDKVLEEYHAEKEHNCSCGSKCENCKCVSESSKSYRLST